MKIKAIIIDDEKLARSRLKRLLSQFDNIEVTGEAQNGEEGLTLIGKSNPDVIFLDIKMPRLSGFEMLRDIEKSPYIIFTTAYDEYALKAFEENTVDYLLKPISEKKLSRAVAKLSAILQSGDKVTVDLEKLLKSIRDKKNILKRFSVKTGKRIFLIQVDEIFFFNSEDKYTFLNTVNKEFIISYTLKELETRLNPEKFIRVHRSYIVNLDHIQTIHKWFGGKLLLKLKNEREITVSRSYIDEFKRKINY